jgi:outer membrane cobalamin receptor
MQVTVTPAPCAKDVSVTLSRATDWHRGEQHKVGRGIATVAISLCFFIVAHRSNAAPGDRGDDLSTSSLKSLSIEDLMNLEITSVSKRGEPLSDAAAAVYVITREEILNSGARSLPDILRLAPNLQVAQITSTSFAITARGFNGSAASKLLVLIDGRSVYTPYHSGVSWDVQDVLPEDIERIEVISGPGATLWGANAVNGSSTSSRARPATHRMDRCASAAATSNRGAAFNMAVRQATRWPIARMGIHSTTATMLPPRA